MLRKKKYLLEIIPDCLSDLFYYDRKECEEVSPEDVQAMFKDGTITKEELKEVFSKAIDSCFED